MTTRIQHFIDGKRSDLASTRTADVLNPSTGEVQAQVLLASKADVDTAVASAVTAQQEWAAWNPQRRARVLMKFIALVNENVDELAELLSIEHGKTVPDAKGDIQRGVEVIEFAIGIPHLLKGEFTEGAGGGIDVYSIRQPLGVVAGITPFNFPAMIPLWKLGPALASGNAVILKPSECDPSVPNMIAALFKEAGLPDGVLQVIHGDKEAVDALLDHPDVKAISFVGSTPIARYVYERGVAAGKRVQALGGAKNHMLVLPDADLDLAADQAVQGVGVPVEAVGVQPVAQVLEEGRVGRHQVGVARAEVLDGVDDLVDESVVPGLRGGEPTVVQRVGEDPVDRLAGLQREHAERAARHGPFRRAPRRPGRRAGHRPGHRGRNWTG